MYNLIKIALPLHHHSNSAVMKNFLKMRISKKYIGYESKNRPNYSENTYEELVAELEGIARSWKKNGGIIIDKDNETLRVSEENGEGEILFEILD